jgi:hypothetical protein
VKEETKEEKPTATTVVPQRLEQPTTLPQVVVAAGVGMFDPVAPHAIVHLQRDIVKTPDEVADLPVHEEVDPGMYESDEFSKDYKSKDDITKKQPSQQELKDSRPQSPEFDIKGKLQLKYDDNIENTIPFQDSKFVDQEKAQLQFVAKDEPTKITETESKKTEKAEDLEAPNIDFSKGKEKVESTEKHTEFTKELKDETETEAHLAAKQDVKILEKLSATTEAIPESAAVDEGKKSEVHKVVPEQLSQEVVKFDTEKSNVEGPTEKETGSSTLVMKEGLDDTVKQEILSESKDIIKVLSKDKAESISCQGDKAELQGVSEFKSIAEESKDEGQMFDDKDKIKHITEKFIEEESHVDKFESIPTDKQDEDLVACETTKPESDKLELETIEVEKTDLEKVVSEKSEDSRAFEALAVKASEAETYELKYTELKKTGKEQEDLEKEAIMTELIKYSEEKDESEKVFPDPLHAEKVLDAKKQLLSEVISEEPATQAKPTEEKINVLEVQFEDEKLKGEEEYSEKLDAEKSAKEESRSEKMEELIIKPEELLKADSVTQVSEHTEIEKHEVTKETEIHTKSSDVKQTTEPLRMDITESEEVHLGHHAETEIKETVAAKEIILTKEATTADEKDIDEEEKPSKDLSLKSDATEEVQFGILKLNLEEPKYVDADHSVPVTEVPNLTAKEESQDKSSTSALSMTYLEIIDKLQKDSQKTSGSVTALTEETLPLAEGGIKVCEVTPKKDVAEQVSDSLSKDDNKTGEKPKTDNTESRIETYSSMTDDTKCIDSIHMTDETKYEKPVGKSEDSVPKTDEVGSDEAVEEKPFITAGHLKDIKGSTEFVPDISKEEYAETLFESAGGKSSNIELSEKKTDMVSDVCERRESTPTGHLPQLTDKDSKDLVKSDTQKVAGGETIEELERSKQNVNETDQAELKLTDDKDDSYGDGSVSPGEAYVDSGLEEEPVYGKLEAPEIPEYVTVTPDSTPASPKSQDKKSLLKTHEGALEQESLSAGRAALQESWKVDHQESTQKAENVTFHEDFAKAKHEYPTDDFLVSDKYDRASDIKEKTLDLVAGISKEDVQTTIAMADIPIQRPVTTAASEAEKGITIIPSGDQPKEEMSSSNLKMDKIGEANLLEDLASASKSAIAETEGKLSTQVEEIFKAPRKEEDETKFCTQETKSEIPSDITNKRSISVDKGLTDSSQLTEKEIREPSEGMKVKSEAESLFAHVNEAEESTLKSHEELKDEATSILMRKETFEKVSPERNEAQTEDKSLTELCNKDITLPPHIAETSTSVTKEKSCLDHDKETSTTVEEIAPLPQPSISATVISKEVPHSVACETDISKTLEKEVTESTGVEQSTVTIEKETIVTTSKSTTVSSSDPTCAATSGITEITSAKAIAEKETTAIITSTIATVSAAQKDKEVIDSSDLTNSIAVRRMVVTASSEDGGVETELCTSDSITFTASTVPATSNGEPVTSQYRQELPEKPVLTSSTIQCTGVTSTDKSSLTQDIKEDRVEVTKDSVSKETFTTVSTEGTTNGDVHTDDHEFDDSASDRSSSSKLVTTKTIKTTTTKTEELTKMHDETETDDKEDVEEFITQETGENGKIITEAVKVTRTFVTVEGQESDDSDFEDEDNIESTAAEDGSDSSRISKITTSFTTVTKRDDNGGRSLSTDSSDKIGDIDSEIITRTTTTTITTVTRTLPGDEADDTMTATALEDGTTVTSTTHDISKDVTALSKKEEISQPSSTESSKLDHHVPLKTEAVMKVETSASSIADGAIKEELTEAIGIKDEEEKLINSKGSDESRTAVSTSVTGKGIMGDLDESSFVSGVNGSVKKEAPSSSSELIRSATPGSDATSDHDLDIGCGPSTPHSDISSGQVSRVATNVWGSSEGRPDSQHCNSDDDDEEDEPGSPLSVTSQLAHSPPSNFYFEMGDRNTYDYDTKHSIAPSTKHKEEVSSSMTSSLYGSLPPDPLQELIKEGKERQPQMSSSFISESPAKHSEAMTSGDSVMTSSFYGSLEEDRKGIETIGAEHFGEQQEDEALDFERAKYEHRAARGKDLASTGSSYHSESTSNMTKTYEHYYMSGVNGQKQKNENSFQESTEDYGNGNVAAGKQYEDLMNQNREIKEKIGEGFADPIDSGFHQEGNMKVTEHISADILKEKNGTSASASGFGVEHDPAFHHQFSTPTTSASCFPEPPLGFTQSSLQQMDDKKTDPTADWGKPLGLPAPAPPPTNNGSTVSEVLPNTNKGTPKKEKKVMQIKKTMIMNENNKAASAKDVKSKRPESPIKQISSDRKGSSNREGGRNTGGGKASGSPIYIDLTYVPHHGNSYYTTLEFFKKVRARYYVFSGTEPSREVYNALLDAKQTWEDKELGNDDDDNNNNNSSTEVFIITI